MTTNAQLRQAIDTLAMSGRTDLNTNTVRAACAYLAGVDMATIARSEGYRTPGQARTAVTRYLAWVSRTAGLVAAVVVPTTPIVPRYFGVEIECIGATEPQIARMLTPVLGYEPRTSGYHGDRDLTRWRATRDGSLYGPGGACELVSPKLRGPEGLDEVRRVMVALVAGGVTVNATCGQHVHIDAQDLTLGAVADMVALYADHQTIIDAFISAPRRSTRLHRYCAPAQRTKDAAYDALKDETVKDWTYSQGAQRYVQNTGAPRMANVNLQAYGAYGTVEFRQHQGTVNHVKSVAWIELMLALTNAALAGEASEPVSETIAGFLTRMRRFGLSEASEAHLRRRARGYGYTLGAPINAAPVA